MFSCPVDLDASAAPGDGADQGICLGDDEFGYVPPADLAGPSPAGRVPAAQGDVDCVGHRSLLLPRLRSRPRATRPAAPEYILPRPRASAPAAGAGVAHARLAPLRALATMVRPPAPRLVRTVPQ